MWLPEYKRNPLIRGTHGDEAQIYFTSYNSLTFLLVSQQINYPLVALVIPAQETKLPREVAACKVDMGWDKLM